MKKVFATTVLALGMMASAWAQSSIFDNLYEDFKRDHSSTTVSLTGNLLTLASIFSDEEEQEDVLRELGRSIDRMKLIAMGDEMTLSASEIKQIKQDLINEEDFDELMTIRDGDQVVDILAIEKDGMMKEVILFINEGDEFVLMDIWGKIDLKNVHSLVEAMDDM